MKLVKKWTLSSNSSKSDNSSKDKTSLIPITITSNKVSQLKLITKKAPLLLSSDDDSEDNSKDNKKLVVTVCICYMY